MKNVLHISTECYPIAKAGGMGDVVGALPIYQQRLNWQADVIIPKYQLKWFKGKELTTVFSSQLIMEGKTYDFSIQKYSGKALAFDAYFVDIPGLFDRDSIYLEEDGHGYKDEPERNIAFQIAVCDYILQNADYYDVIHCHDHQAGLVTFFISNIEKYDAIKNIPTLFTIHNGQYRGIFNWDRIGLLPDYNHDLNGYLDWDNSIHSQATAIKCAQRVTTVSPEYMKEISENDEQLKWLYQNESDKCSGVLNGADYDVWNPEKDNLIPVHLKKSWKAFKDKNKKEFCKKHDLKISYPLFSFIGRLADQKGADLLPEAIRQVFESNSKVSFAILGTGDQKIENELKELANKYPDKIASIIAYNEGIAHEIYAASDFLLMPSRFEPCGLNQLFAMRYATIPVVRKTGGLIDTVPDIDNDGNGITFTNSDPSEIASAMERGIELFNNKKQLNTLRLKIANLDFSWEHSAQLYLNHYSEILETVLV